MRFIYFLRTRTVYVFFAIMFIICIASFVVAGRETLIAYKKQSQEIGSPEVAGSKKIEHNSSSMPTLKNINEVPLYFNGRRVAGLSAFATSKGEVMFPVDDLFNYLKINYTYHYSDGIIEADFNDSKVVLKIDYDTFTVNGIEKQLPFAVVRANDRIMVPAELLNGLNGFDASGKAYLSAAYVNYNPDYQAHGFKGIYYLGADADTAGIYGITDGRYINAVDRDNGASFEYSPYRQSVLYKNNEKSFIITTGMDFIPVELGMSILSRWTEDYKSIYEASDNFNRLSIYSPDSGKIKTIENVREQIASNIDFQDFSYGELKLASYWNYGSTTRITVLNTLSKKICTVLYKKDKPILTATAWLSPNGRYMVYTKDGKYRLCAFDGEQDISLDGAEAVRWITDDTILIYKNGEWSAYDTSGSLMKYRDNNLVYLGVAEDTSVLFRDSRSIYRSVNGIEDKIADIDKNVDNAVASPDFYSIAAGSREDNSVYLIHNQVPTKIGDYSAMLKSYNANGISEDINRSVKFSPDGKTLCAAQLDKNSVILKVMAGDGANTEEIKLDSDAYLKSRYGSADFKYMDNNRIIYWDTSNIWLITLDKDGPKIGKFPKTEENTAILGIMIK